MGDGKAHPIAYASQTTQGAEKTCASSELEALAVLWAMKHFRHYIYGIKCIVYTDNVALKSLLATPHPSGKLARWGLALQNLDLEIRHRPGKENRTADALSREPIITGDQVSESFAPTIVKLDATEVTKHPLTCNLDASEAGIEVMLGGQEMREKQMEDHELNLYIRYNRRRLFTHGRENSTNVS